VNLERINNIPKRHANEEGLARMSWNLASHLAGGRWYQRGVQEVQLHRSVTEKLGREVALKSGRIISPLSQDVSLDFSATKYSGDDTSEIVTRYALMSTVSQGLEPDEMPAHVVDEIFEDEEDVEDIFGDTLSRQELDLNDYELSREQSVEYRFNGLGEIDHYELSYRYSIDETYAYETTYTSEDGVRVTAPVHDRNGEVVDQRPIVLLYLTEANLPAEAEDLDKKWWDFMDENAMRELLQLGGQTGREHALQAMRMLALLSSGLFTTRDLLKKN